MRTTIFYPYLNPPRSWIKQSLLYWDRICTIIPADFDDKFLHSDLIWLRNEGIYEGITADTISYFEEDNLQKEVFEYLYSMEDCPIKSDDWSSTGRERLYYGKLPDKLETCLLEAGYLTKTKRYLEINSGLFGILLCLIAKYLSKSLTIEGDYYSVSTTGGQFEKCNFEPIHPDRSETCIQAILKHFLPVPRETVSLEDILSFRKKYAHDLLQFRRALDSLFQKIQAEGPEERIVAGAIDEISVGLKEITNLLNGAKIKIALGSLAVLVPTMITKFFPGYSGQISWMFSGAALVGILNFNQLMVRPGNLKHPYSYLYLASRDLG